MRPFWATAARVLASIRTAALRGWLVACLAGLAPMLQVQGAAAADCSVSRACIDVATLPPTPHTDMADILRRAKRFFRTNATAYIVSSQSAAATLPYMLPRQPPFVMRHQIHIP